VQLLEDVKGEGIEPLQYTVTIPDKRKPYERKTHLITPRFEKSVDKLLETAPPLSAKAVHEMALSLFKGLARLHALPAKYQGMRRPSFLSYHSDLKVSNLLYKIKPDGHYVAVISDMGTANRVDALCGTLGWMSPQKVQQWKKISPRMSFFDYNTQESQRDDVWSMGLILASLLESRVHKIPGLPEFAPLNCVSQKCVQNKDDTHVAYLTQRELDTEIDRLKKSALSNGRGTAIAAMWNIVKGMTQIDSNTRWTMKLALTELEKIVV
jgi:serine/threonine protein kinase